MMHRVWVFALALLWLACAASECDHDGTCTAEYEAWRSYKEAINLRVVVTNPEKFEGCDHDGGCAEPDFRERGGDLGRFNLGACMTDVLTTVDEMPTRFLRVHTCDETAQTLVADFDCDWTCENCNQKKQTVGLGASSSDTRFTLALSLASLTCPTPTEMPPAMCLTVERAADESYNGQYCPNGAKFNGQTQYQHAVQGSSRQMTWDGNNWLMGPQGSKAKYVSNAPYPGTSGWGLNDFAVNHRIQACIDSCSGLGCILCHLDVAPNAYPVPQPKFSMEVNSATERDRFHSYKSCTLGAFYGWQTDANNVRTGYKDDWTGVQFYRDGGDIASHGGSEVWKWTMDKSNDDLFATGSFKGDTGKFFWNFKPGRLPCDAGYDNPNSDCVGKGSFLVRERRGKSSTKTQCGSAAGRPIFGAPTMGACSNQGLNAHCDACTGPSPSQCVTVTCDSGFFDTDGQASNGCERNAGGVLQTAAPVVVETVAPSVAKANRDSGRVRRVKFRATIELPTQADKQAMIGQRIARDLQAELRKTSPKLLVRFIKWTLATTRRRLLADAAKYDAQLEFDSTATDTTDTTAADAVADFEKRLATAADAQTMTDLLADSVHAVDPTVEFKIAEQKMVDCNIATCDQTNPNDSGSSDSSGFSTGAIAGIIGGAVVAVAVIVGVVVARNKNKNKQNSNENKAAPAGQQTAAKSNHTAAADTSIEIRGAGNEKSSE